MMKQTNTHLLHLTSHFRPALFCYSLLATHAHPPLSGSLKARAEEKKKPVINYSSLRGMLLEESCQAKSRGKRSCTGFRSCSQHAPHRKDPFLYCFRFLLLFILALHQKFFSPRALFSPLTLTNHKKSHRSLMEILLLRGFVVLIARNLSSRRG